MNINILVLIVGAVFFVAGVALLVKQLKSKKNSTAAVTGEVVDYHTETSYDADTGTESVSYFPILRYYAAGNWYEEKADAGRGRKKYDIGARVELLYDPKKPECFRIAGDNSGLILAVIFTLLGVAVCVLSFFAE